MFMVKGYRLKVKGRLTANGQWLMAVFVLFTFHFSLFTLSFAQTDIAPNGYIARVKGHNIYVEKDGRRFRSARTAA